MVLTWTSPCSLTDRVDRAVACKLLACVLACVLPADRCQAEVAYVRLHLRKQSRQVQAVFRN
eukprot:1140465-Pelagomonas_calceolata.AAC.9